MLAYLDDNLGRLFDFLRSSPLSNNTYIMITSDNGPEMLDGEQITAKKVRMPSGMMGFKHSNYEGGTRGFLGVAGPGVPAGVIDSTLLHAVDVVPTITQLAGLGSNAEAVERATRMSARSHRQASETAEFIAANVTAGGDNTQVYKAVDGTHLVEPTTLQQWDGISFAHLLVASSKAEATGDAAMAQEATAGAGSTSRSQAINSAKGELNIDDEEPGDARADGNPASPYRGDALASAQQRGRYLFLMTRRCWEPDSVPEVAENR